MLILPNMSSQFSHGDHQCKMLEKFLAENKKEYENNLIPDLSYINHRAECHNGIDIEDVQHQSGNKYLLNYSYQWSVYNGCENMDEDGVENDGILFTINKGGAIEFDFEDFEERSTHDEF